MNVEIKNYPSARTLVAEICGDIDHHTAKYFRGEIDKAIRSHNPLTPVSYTHLDVYKRQAQVSA